MIRVLQVVSTMDLGGAETLIMNIYRNIDREKVQFDFLCHNRIEAKYSDEIRSLGGKLFCVPGITHGGARTYKRNLYNFFLEHPEYKTVHSHHNQCSGIILTEAKKAGVPNRIAHSHANFSNARGKYRWILRYFQHYFKGSVTKAFACSEIAGKSLFPKKFWNNIEIIPNVIDTDRFRYSPENRKRFREEHGIGDELLIGHVGRFSAEKNHKFILEVFEQLLRFRGDAKLCLAGEGDLLSEIKARADAKGIRDHVIFLGSYMDIPKFLSGMDLFLFPSLSEGLPVSCVEAQASGLPILSSDTFSEEVVLTDLMCRLPLTVSAEKWAEKLIELYETSRESNRYQYAKQVKERGFDVKSLAEKLQTLYLGQYHCD